MLCHQLVAHSISGVPKVQWVKRWFIDLVVPGNLPGRKRCYISNSHLLAPSDRPNMTEILFKNITMQVIHPFTVHFSGTLDCSVYEIWIHLFVLFLYPFLFYLFSV